MVIIILFFSFKNGVNLPKNNNTKYEINQKDDTILLLIQDLNVYDTANYTLITNNKYDTKNKTYDLRKKGNYT